MRIDATRIDGVLVFESVPVGDSRGQFVRFFCAQEFSKMGLKKQIVQINHSHTNCKGTIRGMHFQESPHAENKIVRCIRGACFDVAVDLRRSSPTYLHWHGEILTPSNFKAMLIPEGCAHGFQTLEHNTELLYLHTEYYVPESESGVLFDDPALSISWPLTVTEISERDLSFERIIDL